MVFDSVYEKEIENMCIKFDDRYATFWQIVEKRERDGKKWAEIKFSTKDRHNNEYSSWFGVVLGDKALKSLDTLKEKDWVSISGKITRTPYEKEGTKIYKERVIIYDIKLVKDTKEVIEKSEEEMYPF